MYIYNYTNKVYIFSHQIFDTTYVTVIYIYIYVMPIFTTYVTVRNHKVYTHNVYMPDP